MQLSGKGTVQNHFITMARRPWRVLFDLFAGSTGKEGDTQVGTAVRHQLAHLCFAHSAGGDLPGLVGTGGGGHEHIECVIQGNLRLNDIGLGTTLF